MVFRLLSDVDPASSSRLLAEYLVFSPTSSSIQDLELDTQISLIHKNDQATKPPSHNMPHATWSPALVNLSNKIKTTEES